MWTIIKIILYILLAVLAFLLFVFVCPVFYSVKTSYKREDFKFSAKATALLGILRLKAVYRDQVQVRVYFLFLCIYDSRKPRKQKRSNKAKQKKSDNPDSQKMSVTYDSLSTNEEEMRSADVSGGQIENEDRQRNIDTDFDKHDTAAKDKKLSWIDKVKNFIINIIQKLKNIYASLVHIKDEFEYYKELLSAEESLSALANTKVNMFRICKHILPGTIDAELLIGTGSPDTTGYLCGVYGVISSKLKRRQRIVLIPNFEEQQFEADVKLKGHATICVLIYHSILILFHKDFIALRNELKKHKKQK